MKLYSIRFFNLDKRQWDSRCVRVQANNRDEAYQMALARKKLSPPKLCSIKCLKTEERRLTSRERFEKMFGPIT